VLLKTRRRQSADDHKGGAMQNGMNAMLTDEHKEAQRLYNMWASERMGALLLSRPYWAVDRDDERNA
jgi:hypothetical protein